MHACLAGFRLESFENFLFCLNKKHPLYQYHLHIYKASAACLAKLQRPQGMDMYERAYGAVNSGSCVLGVCSEPRLLGPERFISTKCSSRPGC